jgi:hypothetical protein
MRRQISSIVIGAALALALAASLAWAASKPKTKGYYDYTSKSPVVSVEISVAKSGKSVGLYTSCGSSLSAAEYANFWSWNGLDLKIPFRHGAFSYDKQSSIYHGSTMPTATVMFTGKFKGGHFTGKVHITGSPCSEQSYTARYTTRGGGEG